MSDAPGDGSALPELRAQLDELDESLVDLLARRAEVIAGVIRFKKAHKVGAVDLDREEQMLTEIERSAATKGLDPRIARRVLRAVIDAFTLLEVEELGPSA